MSLLRRVNAGLPQAIGFTRRPFKSLKFAGESLDASDSPALLHGIHVFHCPDVLGIVAKLSECIALRGGNILGADIFVPEKNQVFYSRSEFVFDPAKWPRVQMEEDFLKLSKMFNAMRSVVCVPALDPKYKIAVLASKQDHCLVDLLHGWQDGRLPVDITCIISNHERGSDTHVIRFLERHGIPYHCLHTTKGNKREAEILDLVQDTDFLVLARYMQLLSGDFLSSYGKDVINIHHGLLPSFKGGNPSKQAFDAGVKLIGATSHFVTEELDSGPIIEQMIAMSNNRTVGVSAYFLCAYVKMNFSMFSYGMENIALLVERVSHRENLHSFILKSENLERQCLAKAIKSYCELRVLPYGENKTVVF
ncbi:hypothetical protein RHGRI_031091 [Rhododendron griersonianum]|uniref:ACT domain-containing protein n=1 Tax=Rhododendron griersonianum TaxID=479676 RepID=A0AAV6I711_9ERIC|nr:hypothetical protein RHGRI_031091 [Rhododendron griersonianum]KAG5524302.1 hypothetical protein RHGRI_031091 [Rhododendron griersonianum]KAG5524303.1 hypothetical protein RHGRI_031091 [Rhododendron griersonianum]